MTSAGVGKLVTAKALAAHLGVNVRTVFRQVKRGMPSVAVGAARRFDTAAVLAWLTARQQQGGGDAVQDR